MQKLIIAAVVLLATTAQADVITEALDCKKKFDYSAVKSSLDNLGKPQSIDGQLV